MLLARYPRNLKAVRDHIPLEQGLRQLLASNESPIIIVRDHIPLEQGLRHQGVHSSNLEG